MYSFIRNDKHSFTEWSRVYDVYNNYGEIETSLVVGYDQTISEYFICYHAVERFSEKWYQYSGAIFDYTKDCNLIKTELIYSSNDKWKTGLTLYIIEDEALTLDEYLKLNADWDDYMEYKSKYKDLF